MKNTAQPILVTNPDNNEYLNLDEFFKILNDKYSGCPSDVSSQVDDTIRMINTEMTISLDLVQTSPELLTQYQSAMWLLYSVRDMFEGMKRFKEK